MSWLDYDNDKADKAGSGGGFEPIPVGTELAVRISEAYAKATRSDGQMVMLTLTVIVGKHKGRKIWHNLHVVNRNEFIQHRDRRTLATIAKIVGADISAGPHAVSNLDGCDLLCVVTEHEEDEYNGKKRIKERVGKWARDPEARNPVPKSSSAHADDDDDFPF